MCIRDRFSLEYAQALADQTRKKGKPAREVKCHLKVDTGMGRIGFAARDDLERAVEEMYRCFEIKLSLIHILFSSFHFFFLICAKSLCAAGLHML